MAMTLNACLYLVYCITTVSWAYTQLSDVIELRKNYCIVALLNSASQSAKSKFFDSFISEFVNNRTNHEIKFMQFEPPFKWKDGSELSLNCQPNDNLESICGSEIVVFAKHPEDQTCLHPPPSEEMIRYDAVVETNLLNFDDFAEFVNEHCESYFTSEGKLNEFGVVRSRLEDHLPWSYDVKFEDILHSKADFPKCPEITGPTSRQFLIDYISKSKPVIIRNAAGDWPALSKWSLNYLKSLVPKDRKVRIKVAPFGEFEGVENITLWEDFSSFEIPSFIKRQLAYDDLVVVRPAVLNMKFHSFIDALKSKEFGKQNASLYLEYSSVKDHLEEVEGDFGEFEFISRWLNLDSTNIWLSDGNTLGKLHFDPFDNILVMVEGEKELTLFDPFHNEKLYEAHIQEANLKFDPQSKLFTRQGLQHSTSIVMSPVDIQRPNLVKFPKFADARPVQCRIKKGDALFIPAFWWHEVQSYPSEQNFNLAINFWYEPLFTKTFPCADCKLNFNHKYRKLLKQFHV